MCVFLFVQESREQTSRGNSGGGANMEQLLAGVCFIWFEIKSDGNRIK